MRVYFISSGLQGCYQVRCLLPLQANGWDGDQTSIVPHQMTPENKRDAAKAADIVIFHRPDEARKLELARILKGMGKKIVFDNDDTFKDDGGFKFNQYMNKERLEKNLETMNATLDSFVKEADLVTCSTDFLAEEYKKLNKNVVVIKNCIDPFLFDEPLKNETDIIRIGITGSVGITSDMEVVEPIIEHYKNDRRIKFVLFSMPPDKQNKIYKELYYDEYKFWETVDVEWQPFVPNEKYLTTLNELRLDIMIIPRKDNYFNRCKSNLKFMEASMFEIPCVAQSFSTGDSPYEVDPEDAKHMLLATDTKSWIAQIDTLIENKVLRRVMGSEAHSYVKEKYSIDTNAHQWVEAYEKIK